MLNDFLNPKPAKKAVDLKEQFKNQQAKHGRHAGAHLDDTGDIYDHTGSFFEKQNADEIDDSDLHDKRIRPDID